MFGLALNLLNIILNGENFAGTTFISKCLNFIKQVKFSYKDYSCRAKRRTKTHFWDSWLAQVSRLCNCCSAGSKFKPYIGCNDYFKKNSNADLTAETINIKNKTKLFFTWISCRQIS